ncbi:MAG: BolA family transcriptional regulator, partial [Alteromonas sp.]|nr:BolA family transcriptional regulator [Alteromonas sp.]
VENESHKHRSGTGTSHFRLVIVASAFEGVRLISRHRIVNTLLAHELSTEVHALALHTFTPAEWLERGKKATRSPACR